MHGKSRKKRVCLLVLGLIGCMMLKKVVDIHCDGNPSKQAHPNMLDDVREEGL